MHLIDKLRDQLSSPLPGHAAHRKVMSHRKPIDQLGYITEKARKSAVLLMLYPRNKELHIVFILRQTYKGVHSNQIGLPGGKVEKSDKSLLDTALREATEELDIKRNKLEILGELSPLYVPPSNFVIHPFVAYQETEPEFTPDPYEVASVIECPVKLLLNKEALIESTVSIPEGKLKTKGFLLEEKLLWGATAMIIQEFLEVTKS